MEYFKDRYNNPYLKYTKQYLRTAPKIIQLIALKNMDYPFVPDVWMHKNFPKYIAIMRLKDFQPFKWKDSKFFIKIKIQKLLSKFLNLDFFY